MGPNPIGVNAQHTTCYGTVTRERKPALQYSHSLSKEPPMTPTFRENNAQGENMRKKKWRPSSTASVWPRTPLLAANSQPPLTPELATGPRKLLNSRRAIPHFRYRMLGTRGRRVRNDFNEKKPHAYGWMVGQSGQHKHTHKTRCHVQTHTKTFLSSLSTLCNHPPSNCYTPTPSVDPDSNPLARPRTTIQQVAYATPLRLHLPHSHSVTTKHISFF